MLSTFAVHKLVKKNRSHMSVDSAMADETCTDDQSQKELVCITLGDGDFTWSLDFARYLFTLLSPSSVNISDVARPTVVPLRYNAIRLIATGIDSLNEFQQKYRNYNYTLRELEQFNTKSRTDQKRLHVEVMHEVNAIVDSTTTENSMHPPKGHVIIFNHPHLGTEDAKLHRQFLYHLFHSVHQWWMIPSVMGTGGGGGVFHLTLANGQYERWECHTAAQRHGMKLIQQSAFDPTPSMVGFKSVYGHRRHQTGKSFASRTRGSTTYTFVRACDRTANSLAHIMKLPWFVANDKSNHNEKISLQSSSFICSLCDKPFKEGRSLKNHIASVHSNKRKRSESDTTKFVCNQCNTRSFDSSDALKDHILAKHDGIHSTIVPEWATRPIATSTTDEQQTTEPFGSCSICDATFTNSVDETNHHNLFIPSLVDTIRKVEMIQCHFCQKSFQQIRAQQQHENFCAARGTT